MYRCTCSCTTRALEALIADLAGISIKFRPQSLQRSVRRLHTATHAERTVDQISLQTPATEALQRNLRMIELASVLEYAPLRDATNGATLRKGEERSDVSSARTKAESRMLRKLKRIQGGSHNKHGTESGKLVDHVQEMLQQIEKSPQVLVELVRPKVDVKVGAKQEKPGRGRAFNGKGRWIQGKWVPGIKEHSKGKSAKTRKEDSKRPSAKARNENFKEQVANQRAGEETVEVGDKASWEHVQDEWTEEAAWVPDETTLTKKTTRKEKITGKRPDVDDVSSTDEFPAKQQEPWGIQKSALERKFGEKGWQPRKRLSPDTLSGIRALHASNPTIYNVDMLREHFKITPEAIRRILKSKWRPSSEEIEDRMQRWEKRGVRKWSEMAEQGQKPPKKWRVLGVPNPKLGQRTMWDSNSGITKKEKTEEGLFGKSRRMETAQRTPFKESLAGRIL